MDIENLDRYYEKALENVKRHNTYHLNFGVYYTPKF